MKRALMYASVASMIQQFNIPNIRLLLDAGYEVDVACNMEQGSTISEEMIARLKADLAEMGVRVYHIPIPRKISAISDMLKSLLATKTLMDDRGYSLVHCHSPIGGMICRAARNISKYRNNMKMVYTAHGFHFYKGAPLKNWLFYYPVEKVMAYFTDVLVTINQEDYLLAAKRMKAKRAVFIPGVGLDTQKFLNTVVDRENMRESLGIPVDAILLVSVGELNTNKNHQIVIRAMGQLRDPNLHYIIAGKGDLRDELLRLAKEVGMETNVHLLGYRTDIAQLYKTADICVLPSIREGLNVAALEGMAAGLPLIASDNRGVRDYAFHNDNAFLCQHDSVDAFADAIARLTADANLRQEMGAKNTKIAQKFDFERIIAKMNELYKSVEKKS